MRPMRILFPIVLFLLAMAGAAWLWASSQFGAASPSPGLNASAMQTLDERESGGTWIVRGKLDEEKRLQLLRKGVRCYQFDSRSW